MNELEHLPPRSAVAVIRLRSMGDCVLTTPALRLLKAHRPDLRIGVVVEDRFRGVFEGNPDLDALLAPELASLRGFRPNLLLNLHGGSRSMWMTAASGARIRAGFGHHAYSFVYHAKIPRAQQILGEERPVHTAEHLASAMFWLGVPRQQIPRASLYAEQRPAGLPKHYVAIHPFASAAGKQWPVEQFAQVARELKRNLELDAVILAGPTDDTTGLEDFAIVREAPLAQVKGAIAGAQLFLGNDSGPAHIAAAYGIPVTVLFGPSNPVTWAPWRTEARVLTSRGPIQEIRADQVLAAVSQLKVSA